MMMMLVLCLGDRDFLERGLGGVLMALGREPEIILFPLRGCVGGNLLQVKLKKKNQ